MKIAVIGWYNHANYGDDRMLYSLKSSLMNHDFFIVDGFKDARSKIEEINKCDFVLIGGGGMILKNARFYIDIIEKINKPMGFIGISIETKGHNMSDFFQAMKDKSEFILVRDRSSKTILDNHFKVIFGPDLTFLSPFNIALEVKNNICGLNLRHWQYWKGGYQTYYYYFMEKIFNKIPQASNIYPFKKWDPEALFSILKLNFDKIIPMPLYFENKENIINDRDYMKKYFDEVKNNFSEEIFNDTRYVIGMRLHAIIFSMQSGIPFLSLSYQPKNINFCTDSGLKELSVDIYDPNDLERKLVYLKENYNTLRTKIIEIRNNNVDEINYIFKTIIGLIK